MNSDTRYELSINDPQRRVLPVVTSNNFNEIQAKYHAIIDRLHKINPALEGAIAHDLCSPGDVSERDTAFKIALLQLSTEHPGVAFTLKIWDTNTGKRWMFEAKDGKGTDYDEIVSYGNPTPFLPPKSAVASA
jgi:hypothetical protein